MIFHQKKTHVEDGGKMIMKKILNREMNIVALAGFALLFVFAFLPFVTDVVKNNYYLHDGIVKVDIYFFAGIAYAGILFSLLNNGLGIASCGAISAIMCFVERSALLAQKYPTGGDYSFKYGFFTDYLVKNVRDSQTQEVVDIIKLPVYDLSVGAILMTLISLLLIVWGIISIFIKKNTKA